MFDLIDRIFQTDTSEAGNCHQACVASLLRVPLEEVPNFNSEDGSKWRESYVEFMIDSGYDVIFVPIKDREALAEFLLCNATLSCQTIIAVKSFHHDSKNHCVIGKIEAGRFEITHDPNPQNAQRESDEYRVVTIDLISLY